MEATTATAPSAAPISAVFQEVDSGVPVRPATDGLDPRATRFGFIPIWPVHELPSNAFKISSLPGSRFVPFRVFPYHVPNTNGKNDLRDRLPIEQVIDLYNVAGEKFATDFPELALLENEPQAREILGLLSNPNQCEKYPYELETSCATCWAAYLRTDAPSRIVDLYQGNDRLFNTAKETMKRLLSSLDRAIAAARSNVSKAIRDVDNPKHGKDQFYDVDYLNIWNTHQDMPKTRTTTTGDGGMDELAKALDRATANRTQDVGLSADDVRALIAEATAGQSEKLAAMEEENERLKAQLAATTTPATTGVSFPLQASVILDGQSGTVIAKQFGKYKVEFADKTTRMATVEELTEGVNDKEEAN